MDEEKLAALLMKTAKEAAASVDFSDLTLKIKKPGVSAGGAGSASEFTPAPYEAETKEDTLKGEVNREGRGRQLPEIPDFTAYNPEALLRDYLAGTDQAKTKHIQSGLSFLRRMREEVYQLGGLRQLREKIDGLPGKALIERNERERIELLCDAFWQEQKPLPEEITSGQLVGPLQEMLLTTQGVLKELRQRATTEGVPERLKRIPFPEKLARIRELATEWEALHKCVPPDRYTPFNVAIRDALKLDRGLIVVPEFLEWLDTQEKQHGWEGDTSKADKRSAGIRLSILEKMVAMAKEKLPEFEQPLGRSGQAPKAPKAAPEDSKEVIHSVSRRAKEAYAELVQVLEAHPEAGMQAWFDGPDGREVLPINDAVNKYFDQVRVLSEEYEAGHVDAEEATRKLQSLERKFKVFRERFSKTHFSGSTSTASVVASGSPGSIPPTDVSIAPEKKFRSERSPFMIAKQLGNLKHLKRELGYRDQAGNLYVVRAAAKGNDMFELWYPDKVSVMKHINELSQELFDIGVKCVWDNTTRGSHIEDFEYDPELKGLTPDEVRTRTQSANGVVRRERQRAREKLEVILREKLQLFAERMDEVVRKEEPGLSYANRRGRVFVLLPPFAEKVLEKFGKGAALSIDEQEDMIEKYTISVIIPKS